MSNILYGVIVFEKFPYLKHMIYKLSVPATPVIKVFVMVQNQFQ